MTDRLDCPDCGGSGEQTFGPLTVLCIFCRGCGYVGDDNEPAERNEPADFDPYSGDAAPVWDQPAVEAMPGCLQCFGTGKVVNVGDIRRPDRLSESPCPACAAARPSTSR